MLHFANEEEVYELHKKDGRKIVLFEKAVYDVSQFISEHPGGPEKIEEFFGKDIKEPLEEESHSKFAYMTLRKLPIIGHIIDGDLAEKLEIEIDVAYKKSFCCSKDYVIKKLFTKEDPIYLHKTLGLLSIISFLYRYFYLLPKQGNLGFDGSWFDHLTIALHMALSASSIIFHVLPHRILKRPLVIWNEYRLHAIMFSLRSVFVYFFGLYYPFQNNEYDNLVLFLMVMACHLVVDEITKRTGPGTKAMTTIRGKQDDDGKTTNEKKSHKSILWFYAFYQFCAAGSILIPSARLADYGYNVIIAIQSSAFMMTLFRKGLIRWYTHAFWYTLALALSHCAIIANIPNCAYFYAKIALMFFLRVNFGVDKYLIWTIFCIMSSPYVENLIFQNFETMTKSALESDYLHGLKFDSILTTATPEF